MCQNKSSCCGNSGRHPSVFAKLHSPNQGCRLQDPFLIEHIAIRQYCVLTTVPPMAGLAETGFNLSAAAHYLAVVNNFNISEKLHEPACDSRHIIEPKRRALSISSAMMGDTGQQTGSASTSSLSSSLFPIGKIGAPPVAARPGQNQPPRQIHQAQGCQVKVACLNCRKAKIRCTPVINTPDS